MWVRLPFTRRRAVVPTTSLESPNVIRRSRPERRARLALALRDDPKIAAAASTTLKWTVPPPGRRVDLFTAANVLRSGRNRSVFRRRTANSSCRTRGQRPQAIELPQHILRFEPKLEPEGPGAGCPCANRFPRETAVGRTLERPGSSSRASTPASFRLRRFHDLDGLLLSEPSDVFQSVTLVELVSRKAVPDGGLSKNAGPKTHDPRESPRGAPSDTRPRTAEAILSPTCSWQARTCLDVSLQGFDPPNRPDPMTPIAVASDSTGAAIPGLGGAIRSEPRFATGHTIPPGNGCRLARTEVWTLPCSWRLESVPRRPSSLPEGRVSFRFGSDLRSQLPKKTDAC
jgi:hypothetical protein